MELAFIIKAEPVGKARPRVVRRGSKVRAYTPQATAQFEQLVAWSAKARLPRGFELVRERVELYVTAAMPIPKSWSRGQREQAAEGNRHPTGKPDADNIGKVVADALNGVVYADDAQVTLLMVTKVYSNEPHVQVRVRWGM